MDRETAIIALETARETLKRDGWIQGTKTYPKFGGNCIGTAIPFRVSGELLDYTMVPDLLGFSSNAAVWAWNDADERTEQDIYDKIGERIAYWGSQS